MLPLGLALRLALHPSTKNGVLADMSRLVWPKQPPLGPQQLKIGGIGNPLVGLCSLDILETI
jgi:hypothetical protein